jgi:hypothetical protein
MYLVVHIDEVAGQKHACITPEPHRQEEKEQSCRQKIETVDVKGEL